jgi:hypothetical protein
MSFKSADSPPPSMPATTMLDYEALGLANGMAKQWVAHGELTDTYKMNRGTGPTISIASQTLRLWARSDWSTAWGIDDRSQGTLPFETAKLAGGSFHPGGAA